MRIECNKYEWDNTTEDLEVNFFSSVLPDLTDTIDLMDFYIDGTMSEITYTFEDIDSQNTLQMEGSTVSLQCISNNILSSTELIDFFDCYSENRFIKYKVDFYDDSGDLFYSGIIQKDGVAINDVASKILSITALGYEKEFKEYFTNKPLVAFETILSFETGVGGLRYMSLVDTFYKNFPNVNFAINSVNLLAPYYMAQQPFTYYDSGLSFGEVTLHLKTGYQCFQYDGLNRFDFINSMFLPMGWIWFFYLGKLVIQERGINDYAVLNIDCDTTELTHSLSHSLRQFDIENVLIYTGSYFDTGVQVYNFGTNGSAFHVPNGYDNTGNTVAIYSKKYRYLNAVRPFKSIRVVNNDQYQFRFDGGYTFTALADSNDYDIRIRQRFLIRLTADPQFTVTDSILSYKAKKTLRLNPYVNTQRNAGGIDINNRQASTGAYYGNGNLFYGAAENHTASQGYYTGTVADSIFRRYTLNGQYYNYEEYTRTGYFTRNFEKFLRKSDTIIISITVKQLVTNPLQTVFLENYQDADLSSKYFDILDLTYNPIEETSTLTLMMK